MANSSVATIRFGIAATTLGPIVIARSPKGVCAILFGDNRQTLTRDLRQRFPRADLAEDAAALESMLARITRLVDSPGAGFDLPLDLGGTAFQQRVWRALKRIPPGATASYAEVARDIDAPRSVRAVAQACGANVLALAIPCHRVVRSDGALSGYRWGVDRKRALLDREAARSVG